MPAKRKTAAPKPEETKAPEPKPEEAKANPDAVTGTPKELIKTVSEVQAMSPEDQQAFRDAGGTSIENPTK